MLPSTTSGYVLRPSFSSAGAFFGGCSFRGVSQGGLRSYGGTRLLTNTRASVALRRTRWHCTFTASFALHQRPPTAPPSIPTPVCCIGCVGHLPRGTAARRSLWRECARAASHRGVRRRRESPVKSLKTGNPRFLPRTCSGTEERATSRCGGLLPPRSADACSSDDVIAFRRPVWLRQVYGERAARRRQRHPVVGVRGRPQICTDPGGGCRDQGGRFGANHHRNPDAVRAERRAVGDQHNKSQQERHRHHPGRHRALGQCSKIPRSNQESARGH